MCVWSGKRFHPDDLRTCSLTGLSIHFEFVTRNPNSCLEPLIELLSGVRRTADRTDLWETIAARIAPQFGRGTCRVEFAVISPDRNHLALSIEVKTLLGLRTRNVGCIYQIGDAAVIGEIVQGKRSYLNGKLTFQQ